VKAARLEANYPAGTELKIVVHHRGCPEPVNFTASVSSELTQIVAKVLVGKLCFIKAGPDFDQDPCRQASLYYSVNFHASVSSTKGPIK
jgi:hypothetical protein